VELSKFESAPTRERHPVYEESFLHTTAPEWSTGEVLLAAAYRGLVLGVSESAVDLENIARTPARMPPRTGGPETWARLLTERGGIASPLRHGQYSPMASQQLMPIVPTIGRIAGVLGRRPRSRWNPSNLLLETIGAGAGNVHGDSLLKALGKALEVTANDDVFARFLEESLRAGLQGVDPRGEPTPPYQSLALGNGHVRAYRQGEPTRRRSPAERFGDDLVGVLETKRTLTRRQWTVLLESMLRLGLGMHVLWTCNANIAVWEGTLAVASGSNPPTAADLELAIWETNEETQPILELGANAEPLISRAIEKYAYARTGINLLLCRLDDASAGWPAASPIGFSTQPPRDAPTALAEFCTHVHGYRQRIDPGGDGGQWLRGRVGELFDREADLRALAKCDSGYTKNLFEFARHALGQVKAKDPDQRCYDLSYLLAYSGDRKPLPVQPGPAMLVMLVHACCVANPGVPVSLDDFRRHLGDYGLHVPAGELVHGKTGRDLAMLGLVVDSPDAAGGRLLVRPF
jgi:hypothetical protein